MGQIIDMKTYKNKVKHEKKNSEYWKLAAVPCYSGAVQERITLIPWTSEDLKMLAAHKDPELYSEPLSTPVLHRHK